MNLVEGGAERGAISLRWAAATDVGRVRQVNEDSFMVEEGLYVVADGMGGHEAGDVASRLAVQAVEPFASEVPLSLSQLEDLVERANEAVRKHAANVGSTGMGTTLVGVALVDNAGDPALAVINVGDSRCYSVRHGVVELVTADHSLVQELIEAGRLSAEQAASHPDRNVVTRAIGVEDRVAADYTLLHPGSIERLVLCSDGVSGEIAPHELEAMFSEGAEPGSVVGTVMSAVLDGPARDNATVAVVDVDWAGARDADVTGPRPAASDVDITAPRPQQADAPAGALIGESAGLISEAPTVDKREQVTADRPQPLIDGVPSLPPKETADEEDTHA